MILEGRILSLVLILGLSFSCAAQQAASGGNGSNAPGNIQAGQQPAQTEQEIQKQEQSQRMLGVVPMFSVTSRQTAPPLTPRQKLQGGA